MASKTPKFTMYNAHLSPSKYGVKAPYSMSPIGITIHETDNNASARNEIAYMQRNDNTVSFHFAVDEKEVIQGVPLNRNTWNAGDAHGNGNRRTISIEICRNYRTDNLTNYYAARKRAEELVGWLLYVYGWDTKNIYTHNDWNGKNCPRVIRQEGYLNTFKANALKHRNSYRDGVPVKPTNPVQPTGTIKVGQSVKIKQSAKEYANVKANIPTWVKSKKHTIKQINSTAAMVLLQEINSWINIDDIEGSTVVQPTKPQPIVKTDLELAHEVLRGEHGNGENRRKSLGEKYTSVQSIVDKLVRGESVSKPVAKETEEQKFDRIAKEILYEKHNYGTGATRRAKLGSDYAGVQARINAILAGNAAPVSKPAAKPTPIKVGDMVVVKQGAKDYNGGKVIPQWYTTPKVVSQINGQRVVLDLKGWATPFHMKDLIKR